MGYAILVLIVVAFAAFVEGALFFLVWNDFVVTHVANVSRVSFGAAVLVALAISFLTNAHSEGRD